MNIVKIVRQIAVLPGIRRHALPALGRCVALLEGLERDERRRRRRHHPKPPKD
jgi:hypothetical protein